MTSTNSLPHENPEVVAALERAFQDVWAVLYAHVPLGDAVKEQSIALSQNTGRSGRRWCSLRISRAAASARAHGQCFSTSARISSCEGGLEVVYGGLCKAFPFS
jgi:hypothetical protein